MRYTGSDSNDLYILANELAEANRLKRLEILWAGRAGNMTDESLKKLMDILVDEGNNNLDVYGDFDD